MNKKYYKDIVKRIKCDVPCHIGFKSDNTCCLTEQPNFKLNTNKFLDSLSGLYTINDFIIDRKTKYSKFELDNNHDYIKEVIYYYFSLNNTYYMIIKSIDLKKDSNDFYGTDNINIQSINIYFDKINIDKSADLLNFINVQILDSLKIKN